MKIRILFSANAGICLCIGKEKIWIDALHSRKVSGFSTMSEEMLKSWLNWEKVADPALICYTHCHPDHFCEKMTAAALEKYPKAMPVLPEDVFPGQHTLLGREDTVRLGDVQLQFLRLPHEGQQYADCLHYGILITAGGKHILIPGDCRLCEPALLTAVGQRQIDLAILNFPWLTLSKAGSFVTQKLSPRQTVLYHLPYEQDDENDYLSSARRHCGGAGILQSFLQEMEFEL